MNKTRIKFPALLFQVGTILGLMLMSSVVLSVEAPDAGKALQQIPPPILPPQKAPPPIDIKQPEAVSSDANQTRIKIQKLVITGNTVFKESELLALVNEAVGQELTLAQLQQLAGRITEHYRKQGYVVARAYIPAQEIRTGQVEIAVTEGRYGKINVSNKAGLDSTYIARTLGVKEGDVIEEASLERGLLRLNDTPGVQMRSVLTPGSAQGTSDLVMEISKADAISGSIDVDNHGNRFTGTIRAGATVNLNNPLKRGDQLTLRALTSGSGLTYGRLGYLFPIAGQQTKLGAAYSNMDYELGKDFANLNATGDAKILSLYGIHSFKRSRDSNLVGQFTYDDKKLEDRIGITNTVTNKTIRSGTFSLTGDQRHRIIKDGVSSYTVSLTTGDLSLSADANAIDATSARTAGHYAKLNGFFARQQPLSENWLFYFNSTAQLASKNLDSSEKMALGGPSGVRAYPQGEASGDEGMLLTAELRKLLHPKIQLVGFIDAGTIKLSKNPWSTGDNRRTLSAIGLGANLFPIPDFLIRINYARKLGSENATSDNDKSGRVWIQAIKHF